LDPGGFSFFGGLSTLSGQRGVGRALSILFLPDPGFPPVQVLGDSFSRVFFECAPFNSYIPKLVEFASYRFHFFFSPSSSTSDPILGGVFPRTRSLASMRQSKLLGAHSFVFLAIPVAFSIPQQLVRFSDTALFGKRSFSFPAPVSRRSGYTGFSFLSSSQRPFFILSPFVACFFCDFLLHWPFFLSFRISRPIFLFFLPPFSILFFLPPKVKAL